MSKPDDFPRIVFDGQTFRLQTPPGQTWECGTCRATLVDGSCPGACMGCGAHEACDCTQGDCWDAGCP